MLVTFQIEYIMLYACRAGEFRNTPQGLPARTDLLLLILLAGRILLQLRDLGSQQFGCLVRIGRFLPLVLLRHSCGRHDAKVSNVSHVFLRLDMWPWWSRGLSQMSKICDRGCGSHVRMSRTQSGKGRTNLDPRGSAGSARRSPLGSMENTLLEQAGALLYSSFFDSELDEGVLSHRTNRRQNFLLTTARLERILKFDLNSALHGSGSDRSGVPLVRKFLLQSHEGRSDDISCVLGPIFLLLSFPTFRTPLLSLTALDSCADLVVGLR